MELGNTELLAIGIGLVILGPFLVRWAIRLILARIILLALTALVAAWGAGVIEIPGLAP